MRTGTGKALCGDSRRRRDAADHLPNSSQLRIGRMAHQPETHKRQQILDETAHGPAARWLCLHAAPPRCHELPSS